MHVFDEIIARYPKLAGVFGLVIAIIFSALGTSAYLETKKIGKAPQEASLVEISDYLVDNDKYWVIVIDGLVNCESIHSEQVGSTTYTEIFLELPDKSLAMLITYSPELSCDVIKERVIHGVAYAMSKKHKAILQESGRLNRYPSTTTYLELCTTCGRPSAAAIIFLSAILAILGLSLYPLALWRKNVRHRPALSTSADDLFDK